MRALALELAVGWQYEKPVAGPAFVNHHFSTLIELAGERNSYRLPESLFLRHFSNYSNIHTSGNTSQKNVNLSASRGFSPYPIVAQTNGVFIVFAGLSRYGLPNQHGNSP
jgi:hypothetical protein